MKPESESNSKSYIYATVKDYLLSFVIKVSQFVYGLLISGDCRPWVILRHRPLLLCYVLLYMLHYYLHHLLFTEHFILTSDNETFSFKLYEFYTYRLWAIKISFKLEGYIYFGWLCLFLMLNIEHVAYFYNCFVLIFFTRLVFLKCFMVLMF